MFAAQCHYGGHQVQRCPSEVVLGGHDHVVVYAEVIVAMPGAGRYGIGTPIARAARSSHSRRSLCWAASTMRSCMVPSGSIRVATTLISPFCPPHSATIAYGLTPVRSRRLAVSCQTERSPKRWILLQERCSGAAKLPNDAFSQVSAPGRIRTRDPLLRRSFHAGGQAVAFLIRAGLLVVWLQLNVSGFRLVLARGWHEARFSM